MPDHPPPKWPWLSSRRGPDLPICKVRFDTLRNPRTGAEMERLVLEVPDWVNVIALTPERDCVLVRQYRFGTGEVELEVPGGVIDPGEDSGEAARRELREETGYTSERWTYLGSCRPNPAFQTNLCHHWLAEDAVETDEMDPDPGEDLRVERLDVEGLRRAVADGTLGHSLVVVALSKVLDLRSHPL